MNHWKCFPRTISFKVSLLTLLFPLRPTTIFVRKYLSLADILLVFLLLLPCVFGEISLGRDQICRLTRYGKQLQLTRTDNENAAAASTVWCLPQKWSGFSLMIVSKIAIVSLQDLLLDHARLSSLSGSGRKVPSLQWSFVWFRTPPDLNKSWRA